MNSTRAIMTDYTKLMMPTKCVWIIKSSPLKVSMNVFSYFYSKDWIFFSNLGNAFLESVTPLKTGFNAWLTSSTFVMCMFSDSTQRISSNAQPTVGDWLLLACRFLCLCVCCCCCCGGNGDANGKFTCGTVADCNPSQLLVVGCVCDHVI